jgi:DNA-binding beta-propeller fold protein YncE
LLITGCAVVAAQALFAAATSAQTVVEPGWSLIRMIPFENPVAARLHPWDGRIYVARRDGSSNGLYRISIEGFPSLLVAGSDLAGVCIDPASGAIFQSDSVDGIIYRTAFASTGRTAWVAGFHSGDDDPGGLAVAPANYRGRVLAPGSALVADYGFNGPDEIWRWSPATAEGEIALHGDNGTLVDAYDIAIGREHIYAADNGGTANGTIYRVNAGGVLTAIATSQPLPEPTGIAVDPRGETLLVTESSSGSVVRVDPATGQVSTVITGLSFGAPWPSIEATADGSMMVVSAFGSDTIYVFARCDATDHPELDCDGNGIADICDLTTGSASDCNRNGVLDSCDIANSVSPDCNGDGVPDECPNCPPVEVVFIMDTSSSMNDEAAGLCAGLPQVAAALGAAGLEVHTTALGICDLPGGAYVCLEDTVIAMLGTAVPGNPSAAVATLGACPGGLQVCSEDWGSATSVVAGLYPWSPPGKSVRVVIPIADEGPWCGDPATENDSASITHAISVATANDVFVSPIMGSGASAGVVALAEQLAQGTGGQSFSSSKPSIDIAESIVVQVLAACSSAPRCMLGDLNCDGTVNAVDLGILLGAWNSTGTVADINCSGSVDASDLSILLGAWSA